ncbi:MAG: hypothetical protein F4X37_04225 [Acidimicrobiia bacterium]|nr:hypothetical protein [Acidimicrobiia bacterium]
MAPANTGNGGRLGRAPNSRNNLSALLLLTVGDLRPAVGLHACGIHSHPIQGGFSIPKPVALPVGSGGNCGGLVSRH